MNFVTFYLEFFSKFLFIFANTFLFMCLQGSFSFSYCLNLFVFVFLCFNLMFCYHFHSLSCVPFLTFSFLLCFTTEFLFPLVFFLTNFISPHRSSSCSRIPFLFLVIFITQKCVCFCVIDVCFPSSSVSIFYFLFLFFLVCLISLLPCLFIVLMPFLVFHVTNSIFSHHSPISSSF